MRLLDTWQITSCSTPPNTTGWSGWADLLPDRPDPQVI